MTDIELTGTAQILRRQSRQAYRDGESTQGIELAYRASLLEIELEYRGGQRQRPTLSVTRTQTQATSNEGRAKPGKIDPHTGKRIYLLKQTDSDITRGVRRSYKQIQARHKQASLHTAKRDEYDQRTQESERTYTYSEENKEEVREGFKQITLKL